MLVEVGGELAELPLGGSAMHRSLYKFSAGGEDGALSFKAGEGFVVLDTIKDPLWWLVVDSRGVVGYVPANYLGRDDVSLLVLVDYMPQYN